jgi:hypothetical protein
MILGTCRSDANPRDRTNRVHGQRQVKALIPSQPMPPTNIGQPRQPACASALGIAGGNPGAVQCFVATRLRRQQRLQMEEARGQRTLEGRAMLSV